MSTRYFDAARRPSCDEDLKRFARHAAEELAGGLGGTAARALRMLGALEWDGTKESAKPDIRFQDGSVGIWRAQKLQKENVFVRSADFADEWALWANVQTIPPKRLQRIVLLGESVARGYFYEPNFTPAHVLRGMLQSAMGEANVDVVDLARTNLDSFGLIKLMEECVQLEPDVMVIFAGNNWLADTRPRGGVALQVASRLLSMQGLVGLTGYYERRLAALAEHTVAVAEAIALRHNLKVVLLVPEFNLLDWRDEVVRVPWLVNGSYGQWLNALQSAEVAWTIGKYDECADLARNVIELDGGLSAAGLSMLARCEYRVGRMHSARQLLERARDAQVWDSIPQTPRIFDSIKRVLRRAASDRVSVIDLGDSIDEYLDGGLPDRRLFLDYCHLNSRGIQLAMATTAESILGQLGLHGRSAREFLRSADAPTRAIESEAHFGAAIHNAHHGQSAEIVAFHCEEALRLDPGIGPTMQAFAEMQSRRAPMWMCAGTALVAENSEGCLRRYLLSYATTQLPKRFDEILLNAIDATLLGANQCPEHKFRELCIEEYGLRSGASVDLLDVAYAPSWFHPDWEELWTKPIMTKEPPRYHYYFRAHSPSSEFVVVLRNPASIRLNGTFRRSGLSDDLCRVFVNDVEVCAFMQGTNWQRQLIVVDSGLLNRGTNRIRISWPTDLALSGSSVEGIAKSWEQGVFESLAPCFGHIQALSAQLVE